MTSTLAGSVVSDNNTRVSRILSLCVSLVNVDGDNLSVQEELFAELDGLLDVADNAEIEAVLSSPTFMSVKNTLHSLRASYEYAREVDLADDIIAENNAAVGETFRSHDWYDKALDFETNALAPYALKSILFVGSGPFPTSPMAFLRNNPGATVTCMDRSADACKQAEQVSEIYGLPDLKIRNTDGASITDFKEFDCVIVGLVVGSNDEKKQPIVDHFLKHVPDDTLLCFRSATGSGRIIYPSVDLDVLGGLDVEVLEGPPHKSFTLILVKR